MEACRLNLQEQTEQCLSCSSVDLLEATLFVVNSYLHAGDAETCDISDDLVDVVVILHGELHPRPSLGTLTPGLN